MKNLTELRYHLFDGEGDGLGTEASAFMDSLGGEQKKQSDVKSDLANIQYGRQKDEAQTSRIGSDNKQTDINAEFEALIGKGGKYHDAYGQKVSGAIQDRFKNQGDLQSTVDQYNEAMSPLFMNYGLETGDIEGLKNALAGDDSFYQHGAEKAGLGIDQYKENLKLKAEAERGRQITEAYEQQKRANEMYAQWDNDAAELQQAFPNFDLGMEIKSNPQFAAMLDAGVNVQDAFFAVHRADILNGFSNEANKAATQNVVNTIQQRSARPVENAMSHAPAMQRKSDPSSLTNDDMDEIFRRVESGGTISF